MLRGWPQGCSLGLQASLTALGFGALESGYGVRTLPYIHRAGSGPGSGSQELTMSPGQCSEAQDSRWQRPLHLRPWS